MWQILDIDSIVAIYAAIILIPFAFAYFIMLIADWWLR